MSNLNAKDRMVLKEDKKEMKPYTQKRPISAQRKEEKMTGNKNINFDKRRNSKEVKDDKMKKVM